MKTLTFIAALGLLTPIVAQKNVADIFNVDFGTDDAGGCQYIGQQFMQNLVDDAHGLAEMGLTLLDDYGKNKAEARRLMDSFFKPTTSPLTAAQLKTLRDNYTKVRDWLNGIGKYNGGQGSGKPFLLCHHTWLKKYKMEEEALDFQGEGYPNIQTGEPETIQGVDKYVDAQQDESTALQKKAVPYFSSKHNGYIFDQSYGGATTGYCSRKGNTAATQHVLSPSSITLCRRAFTANPEDPDASTVIQYNARLWADLDPIAESDVRNKKVTQGAQTLKKVLPTAVTLLHELFHLVIGNVETYPDYQYGEIYGVLGNSRVKGIAYLEYDLAAHNPESYALASIAYDYTTRKKDSQGRVVEFCAGYATYQ